MTNSTSTKDSIGFSCYILVALVGVVSWLFLLRAFYSSARVDETNVHQLRINAFGLFPGHNAHQYASVLV